MAFSGIPLPKVVADVGPGGPIVTGMQGANALDKSNLQNKFLSAQLPYAPYNAYADALSKIAYAQMAGPQTLATILSSPAAVSRMSPETYNALAKLAQQGLGNIGNINIPQPNQITSGSQTPIGNVYNALKSLFYGEPSKSNNNLVNLPGTNGQNVQPTPQFVNAVGNLKPGESVTMGIDGQPINNTNNQPIAGGYSTPASQQAAATQTPGTMGGVNPASGATAQEKGFEEAATGQARAATEQWKEGQTQASTSADLANNIINNAKGFHKAYQKSFYTGARLGSLPSEGLSAAPTLPGHNLGDEQIADRYSNNMLTSLAQGLQKGHITDTNFQLFNRLKLARPLDKNAEEAIYKSTIATAERLKENRDFYNYIRRTNPDITKPEADGLFGLYNSQLPPYDFNTLKPLEKNNGKWKLYSSKEAVNKYRENGTYQPKGIKSKDVTDMSDEELRKIVYGR